MKKVLNVDDDYDFSILGISCHAKDYRLCWEINRALQIDLEKQNDILSNNYPDVSYSNAFYNDEENHLEFVLLSNKSEGGMVIPEYPQLDYFLKISGPQHEYSIADYKNKLQNIDLVLAAIELDPQNLRSKFNLVF